MAEKKADHMLRDTRLKECISHGTKAYPMQYYVDELHLFENHETPLHWHHELEFFVVHNGAATIQAGTQQIILRAGSGIFINSNVFHSYRQCVVSPGEKNSICQCPNIVFSEELLSFPGSSIGDNYVKPILLDRALPYILLEPGNPWQNRILEDLDEIFSLLQKYGRAGAYGTPPRLQFRHCFVASSCHELRIQALLATIWQEIYCHRTEAELPSSSAESSASQLRMRKMLQFIGKNYGRALTLEEIARSASISKSECNRCFHQYAQCTPFDYLLDLRVKKAKQSLRSTNEKLEQIALENGFSSASYFCRIFRQRTGMTASAYRNLSKENV